MRRVLAFLLAFLVCASAWALTPTTKRLLLAQRPPSLDLNFANGVDGRIVYTGQNGTYFDSTGTLQAATTNKMRLDWNPATLNFRGALIEEARTNSIRNSTMVGAVASVAITPQTISTLTNVTTTATMATGSAHGLATGNIITVSGATPAAYNGTFSVTVLTGTTLTYAMASDPGGSASPVGSYTAATAGTLPTNWIFNAGTGMVRQIVATGTENGIAYVDLRFVGTSSGAQNIINGGYFDATTAQAASSGQLWAQSAYLRLIAGSLSGMTIYFNIQAFNSVPTYLGSPGTITPTPTGASLNTQRFSISGTMPATTATVVADMYVAVGGTQAVDFTLRVGLPQLELGAFATSAIKTSGSAVTRAADVAYIPTSAFPFNVNAGTWVVSGSVASSGHTIANAILEVGADASNVITNKLDSTLHPQVQVFVTGSSQGSVILSAAVTPGVSFTEGYNYSVASRTLNLSAAGSIPSALTAAAMPSLGFAYIGGGLRSVQLDGWISRICYYPYAMNSFQLQAATR